MYKTIGKIMRGRKRVGFIFLDKNGKELSINTGKSYFAINETGKSELN